MAEDEHPGTPEEEAEMLKRLEDQIRRMSVAEHLAYMLESLAALATRKLGLTSDTEAERDLDQARLAIDAFRALLQVVEPTRPSQEAAAHRGMLSQLQLAYVTATQLPAAASSAEADCEPSEAVNDDNIGASEEGALPLED